MSEELWLNAANAIIRAGQIPIPANDTLLELLKTIMNEEQAQFIQIFDKPLNIEEVKAKVQMEDEALVNMLDKLMHNGIMTGIPSNRTGQVIYRLMPPLPGLFEFTLMRGETTDKTKKLAGLFDKMFGELSEMVQGSYDDVVGLFKTVPPMTRVVPIEQEITEKVDHIMPYEEVSRIVDKFDPIAVATCYCRHEKSLLGKECSVTKEKENCLFFGKTARFVIDYKFGKEVTKDQAKQILKECEKSGLVHKSFHDKQDIEKDEFAICNCCKCCCGTFELYYRGAAPAHTFTAYVAKADADLCTECETCVDMCPMEAITLEDGLIIEESNCIGCGVCAYNCPADAIKLQRTGKREVFMPPKKISITT